MRTEMRTEILPYQRLGAIARSYTGEKQKNFLQALFSKSNFILFPTVFLLGRASLVGGLMPFGFAMYATTLGLDVNRVLIAAFAILGMITSGAKEQIYITLTAMLLFNAFNIPFKKSKINLNIRYSVIAFISILIPEMLMDYLQGFLLFDMMKSLLHCFIVFLCIFIFRNAVSVVNPGAKKQTLSNEELISIAILAALAISGLSNIQLLGFNIKNILCILSILTFSYKCGPGVGSAIGVTVGLIVNMSTTAMPATIASYAFCGLLSGVLRNLGKVGSSLGFILGNAILTLYLNGSTDVLIYLKEIVLVVIIFMLIPEKYMDMLVNYFNRSTETGLDKRGYSTRIKELTVERLNRFSRAFKELSRTFSEISETKVVTDKQDISALFDRVADKVCKNCGLCMHCWDRNFYNTYQVMFKIVEKLDSKGWVEEADIPDYFIERCERINDFVQAVNNVFEIFRVDAVWKNKIGESRGLVSQQLEGLSEVISNLASEIDMDVHFKSDLEDLVLIGLRQVGVSATEVIVYENKWGKYEINIFHKGCGGKRTCVSTIEKVVSDLVGKKMTKENGECYLKLKGGACNLRLIEKESLRVTTGIAKVSKYESVVSGDSYTFMNPGDGKYIVALSDGMGSGQKAANQSRATISLLEQFMESGFDKDTAIRLINSILVLKSNDDSFSTIDMSVIDLYSGEVEFVKVGAVHTYIKRKENVETVKMVSLPAGILSNIEMELVHRNVEDGDFIIMMTDGISDSFKKDGDDEKSLQRFIQGILSVNPQEIADQILNEAYTNCQEIPIDDMMVVVSKVWRSVN